MIRTTKTLAVEMNDRRLTVTDALRIATLIAERLREAHDRGEIHGALSPASVALDGDRVQLLPAVEGIVETGYAAPEILQGGRADARSDIFSFGAILLDMLTAARDLENGNAVAERLVKGCLTTSPELRFRRMQNVIVDLRLLAAATRRSASGVCMTATVCRNASR